MDLNHSDLNHRFILFSSVPRRRKENCGLFPERPAVLRDAHYTSSIVGIALVIVSEKDYLLRDAHCTTSFFFGKGLFVREVQKQHVYPTYIIHVTY